MLLSHILLARGEVRAGEIELRGSLVERVERDYGAVFADRALGIVLREPQIAEMPVKVFVNRGNVIEAVESGRRVRGSAEFFFERSQLFQRLRIASAHFFVVGQDGGGGLLVSFRQIGLGHELVRIRGIDVFRIEAANFLAFLQDFIVILVLGLLHEILQARAPLVKVSDGFADVLVQPDEKLPVEFFRLHGQVLPDHIRGGFELRKGVHHVQ